MFKAVLLPVSTALLLTVTAGAQQAQTPPAAKPPQEQSTAQAPDRSAGVSNVRIEITITEEGDAAPAGPRNVTMVIADQQHGRIRSGAGAHLNVDAAPHILRDGRVRVHTSIEYNVGGERALNLSEALTSVLDDGRPLVISQSADPRTNRRVKVEVKATILK